MKKKQIILIAVIFILLSFNGNAQKKYKEYYNELNKSGNFTDTDSILKYQLNALEYAQPLPSDLIGIAFSYYEKKKFKKSSYYFCEAIKHGYQIETDEDYIKYPYKIDYDFTFVSNFKSQKNDFSDFINFMFKKNKKKAKKIRKKFIRRIDKIEDAKYEFLLQNEFNFQEIRLEILPNEKLPDTIVKIIHKYANIGNANYMLDMLKNNTFPYRLNCRRFNSQSINMLLNHAIASFVKKDDAKLFIDLLWGQVENGNITPKDYANAMDHYTQWYINKNKSLLATTTFSEDFKTFQCMDVLYPEKLNELRKQYWLEDIEVFCNTTNFKLPKNYINK